MQNLLTPIREKLLALQAAMQAGEIDEPAYRQHKALLERQLVDAVLAPVLPQASDSDRAQLPASAPLVPAAVLPSAPSVAHHPIGAGVWWTLGLISLALVGAWLAWRQPTVSPDAPPPISVPNTMAGPTAAALDAAKVEPMIQSLKDRLRAKPDDAALWAMLARTYAFMGRATDASEAYASAVRLSPKDPGLLVDYADALAIKNERSLEGEPIRLVMQALQLDARNVKGLAIAGQYAFGRQDFEQARKYWEDVMRYGAADSIFVRQIQPQLAALRERTRPGVALPKAVSSAP